MQTQVRSVDSIPDWAATEKAVLCLQVAQLLEEQRSLSEIVDLLEILQEQTDKAQMIATLIDTAKTMSLTTLNQWLKNGITLKHSGDRAKGATRRGRTFRKMGAIV